MCRDKIQVLRSHMNKEGREPSLGEEDMGVNVTEF